MNKVQSSYFDSSAEFPSLGSFSFEDFESITAEDFSTPSESVAQTTTQYNIIIKRNDGLYKTLSVLNTVFSILAVLLIVATFITVFYSLITITEVSHIAEQVRAHNSMAGVSP